MGKLGPSGAPGDQGHPGPAGLPGLAGLQGVQGAKVDCRTTEIKIKWVETFQQSCNVVICVYEGGRCPVWKEREQRSSWKTREFSFRMKKS